MVLFYICYYFINNFAVNLGRKSGMVFMTSVRSVFVIKNLFKKHLFYKGFKWDLQRLFL